jgi:hypothetical protein
MDEVFGLIETAEKAAEVYTVASPISVVPGTIHGRMETPSGKTTKHSVHICHNVRVVMGIGK